MSSRPAQHAEPTRLLHGEATAPAPAAGVRLAARLGVLDVGRALHDFSHYLPAQAVQALTGAVVLPILARWLSPTDLGVLIVAQTLLIFGAMLASNWVTAAVVRELSAHRDAATLDLFERTLARALAISCGAVAAFAGALVLAGHWSSAIATNLPYVVGGTFAVALHSVAIRLLSSGLRSRASAFFDGAARVGSAALGIALVFDGRGVHGYLLALVVSYSIVGLAGVCVGWPRSAGAGRRCLPEHELARWLRYGVPAAASGLLVWGLFLVDRYLLAGLRNESAVGVYSVGAVIGDKSVSIPILAFFTAASPLLVRAFERHGRSEVERLMRSYTRVFLLLGLPVIAYLVANVGILVPLLAGTLYYHHAAAVAPIVAAGSLVYGLALIGTTGLIVARRTVLLACTAAVGLVANVVANLFLIPAFGIEGAAVATPIGMLAYLVAVHVAARPYATWRFPYPTLARTALAAAAGFVVARELERLSHWGPAELLIGAGAGGAAYVAALWLLREHRAALPLHGEAAGVPR